MSTGDPAGLVQADDVDAIVVADQPGERTITARSPMQLFWRRLRRDKVAMAALVFIVLLILDGDLRAADRRDRRHARTRACRISRRSTCSGPDRPVRRASVRRRPARPRHLLPHGLRRPRLARGRPDRHRHRRRSSARSSASSPASTAAGPTRVLSRITDVVLAFPILLLGLGLAAACSGAHGCSGGLIEPGLPVVIMVIAIINWTYIARIVRGQVLSLREKEFVESARSLGASNRPDHHPRDPAEPPRSADRLLLAADPREHPARGGAVVPRRGRRAAAPPPGAAMISEATNLFPEAWWFMLFPGLALLLRCWPSTSWATGCRTPSTRAGGEVARVSLAASITRKDRVHD